MKTIKLVFLAVVLAVALGGLHAAWAGWEMTDADGQKAYLSKGRVKITEGTGGIIMDGNKDVIIMFDDERRVFTSGSVADYCKSTNDVFAQMMKNVPEEQRAMVEQMMNARKKDIPKVEILDKGDGGKVAGFATRKYEVNADGALYEEVWVTTDAGVMKDYKPLVEYLGKFMACTNEMMAMMKASPQAAPEYAVMWGKGFRIRSITHEGGETSSDMDVQTMEKKDIADAEFGPPAGFRQVTFQELVGMPGQQGE